MSVIDVDPVGYESARDVFYDVNADVVTSVSALSSGLGRGAGMAGCDSSGVEWATSYDTAATQAMEAGSTATEALGHLGDLLGTTGANHADADARSTIGGYPGATTGVPGSRAQAIYCPAPPSADGSPGDEPPGWDLIAGALGMVWPNGHQDQLRAVATAWSTAATDLHTGSARLTPAISDVDAQRSPEVPAAVQTCTDLQTGLGDLADAYTGLAQACTDYAAHLDEAHQAVIDELESLLAWTIGIEVAGGVLAFFTVGTSEIAAQAAVATRIAAAVARITAVLTRLATLVRAVIATIARFAGRIGQILSKLKGLLTRRVVQSTEEAVSAAPQVVNAAGKQFPHIIDPRTGAAIAPPPAGLVKVPLSDRVAWGAQQRGAYIKAWYDAGLTTPAGGWARYDIHHIIPREYGGSNVFENLVPVLRTSHQQQLNPWWLHYGG